jgi:hypothetical protein
MAFQVREIVYKDRDFLPGELITITEAAELIGLSPQGIISAINRGALTEVIDNNYHHGRINSRRLIIRAEVSSLVKND